MAAEDKRIVGLTDAVNLTTDDYFAVDNPVLGTRKINAIPISDVEIDEILSDIIDD